MKPTRITLVRHARSAGNIDKNAYARTPDWKIPLTEEGHGQARQAGLVYGAKVDFGPVAVYLSPYLRTRQTTDGIVGALRPAQIERRREDPRLREQEWAGGFRAVMTQQQIADLEAQRDTYGSFFFRINHGESGADVYDRCGGFLDTLYRDFQRSSFPDEVLIVTHGFTMRVLLMRWLHLTVEQFHELKNPENASMFELIKGADDRYQLATPFPKETTP